MARIFKLSLFILLASQAWADNVFQKAQTFTLRNGMHFVVIPHHRAPVVMHTVIYNVGAADDPLGKGGTAHLLEHLMFRGTKQVPDQDFKRIIAQHGASQNASTDWDTTLYYEVTHPKGLAKMMELEADRMQNLDLNPNNIAPELKVIREEYQNRIGDNPFGQLSQAMLASFFWNHPYRRQPGGWRHEIDKATHEDVVEVYNTWYAPNNATCFIIGDVDFEKVKALAEQHYGPIPPKKLPEHEWAQEPKHFGESIRVTMRHERLNHTAVHFYYPAPNWRSEEGKQHFIPLVLLEDILAAEGHGLLYQSLVDQQKLALNVHAKYEWAKDPLWFAVTVAARELADISAAETALDIEMRRLVNIGISAEAVDAAKKQAILNYHSMQDDIKKITRLCIQSLILLGMNLDDLKNFEQRVQAITVDQVNAALRAVFNQSPRLIAASYPIKQRPNVDHQMASQQSENPS